MISIRGVSKRFGDKAVLDAVTLEVPRGCVTALIGPGASGKSVLLKVVAGLVSPDVGSVAIGGAEITNVDDLARIDVQKRIGMLFQNYALFDFMSVGENVAFPLRRLFALSEDEIASHVRERLARVALAGFETRDVRSLSGGQKKRVGVARATVATPEVLLYDEPTAGLDPVTSQKIYDLIRQEQRERETTCIVISSDVAGVLTIADRVAMLHRGKLIFDGLVDDARETDEPHVHQFVHGQLDGPL